MRKSKRRARAKKRRAMVAAHRAVIADRITRELAVAKLGDVRYVHIGDLDAATRDLLSVSR